MKVKKQDKLVILSALLVGIISGSYLYLVGFAPEFQSGQGVAKEDDVVDFMVVGEMYGGMRAGLPPSFQLEQNGSYRYVPFSDNPELPGAAVEGMLPKTLMRDLKSQLNDDYLVEASVPATKANCQSFVDGVDYQYIVLRDGVEYELDSCHTNFQTTDVAGQSLTEVWDYLNEANNQ